MYFSKVHLENWRNFPKVDIPLQRRVFLVGPNASGKSNLLEVFRFLHDIVSIGGGFQSAVMSRGGVSRIRSLSARRYPDIAIRVEVGNGAHPWTYALRFSQDNLSRPVIKEERVLRGDEVILNRPDSPDRSDADLLRQTHLEQVSANREFRDVAEFFKTIRYLHLVPQLVREPDRSAGKKGDPYGGDFLEQVASTTPQTRDARLRRLKEALQVAVPQLKELELHRDERGTPHLRGLYEHWRPNAGWQTEEQFSDGTLRLLGLLWSLLDGNGPLLLEEPELSLHPEVVTHIPAIMARIQKRQGRQVIVSTHSSDLLQDRGIASNEVLILRPGPEGTLVEPASSDEEIEDLLRGGLSIAEAVLPRSRPENVEQLSLFGG